MSSAPVPHVAVPDLVPVLSRGKHRNPRRGACFMELASFLAGERWSDRPACTHPLLAEVARNVNDRTSDAARPLLATLIPTVVGLSTDDERADARLALRCTLLALPVAVASRQRSLAVAVLGCLRQLTALGDPEIAAFEAAAAEVLDEVPDARRWAVGFAARSGLDRRRASTRHFHRYAAPGIVKMSAVGVAEAAMVAGPTGEDEADRVLRAMLEAAIAECQALADVAPPAPVDDRRLQQAWALTR